MTHARGQEWIRVSRRKLELYPAHTRKDSGKPGGLNLETVGDLYYSVLLVIIGTSEVKPPNRFLFRPLYKPPLQYILSAYNPVISKHTDTASFVAETNSVSLLIYFYL